MLAIGSVLKEARIAAGLTQAQLSARIGIGQGSISTFEAGKASPAMETLQAWLDACGYDLEFRRRPTAGTGPVERHLTPPVAEVADAAGVLSADECQALAGCLKALPSTPERDRRRLIALLKLFADEGT